MALPFVVQNRPELLTQICSVGKTHPSVKPSATSVASVCYSGDWFHPDQRKHKAVELGEMLHYVRSEGMVREFPGTGELRFFEKGGAYSMWQHGLSGVILGLGEPVFQDRKEYVLVAVPVARVVRILKLPLDVKIAANVPARLLTATSYGEVFKKA